MLRRNIIVIGTSAGGVEALQHLVRGLPEDLPASVFVVTHVPAYYPSVLPQILSRAGKLPAVHAFHDDAIEEGKIFIAPPGYHMVVHQDSVNLNRGPKEQAKPGRI